MTTRQFILPLQLCVCLLVMMLSGHELAALEPCKNTQTVTFQADQPIEAVFASTAVQQKGMLLLFINPNGAPCQMQMKIIIENAEEIEKRYFIRPIQTTEPKDRTFFYQFGIRSLPAIILLKANGEILHRFPPGIQTKQQILDAMRLMK